MTEHRLVKHRDAHRAIHKSSINRWLAVVITRGVGSMWCAYAFTALALVALPQALASHNVLVIIQWVAQTFLQLVLLSIIIVGQQVLAEASDQRAESDHETLNLLLQLLELQECEHRDHAEALAALRQTAASSPGYSGGSVDAP